MDWGFRFGSRPDAMATETILGPYGEGYCETCRFTVGLDRTGRLSTHSRGIHLRGGAVDCVGSGTEPPAETPYSVADAEFRVNARYAACHICSRRVPTLANRRLTVHDLGVEGSGTDCPGGYRMPEKDHTGERG